MNIRKINLALSLGLLEQPPSEHPLHLIRHLLADIKEVGQFLGEQFLGTHPINRSHQRLHYALRYEHCTVDLELVQDLTRRQPILHSLRLK